MRCNHATILFFMGAILLPFSAQSGEKRTVKSDTAWPTTIKARYNLSFNGIGVGRIKFKSSVSEGTYSLTSSGKVSVLFGAMSWSGSSSVSGNIEEGSPSPGLYKFAWRGKKKRRSIKVGFQDRIARDIAIKPSPRVKSDTVPLKPDHLANAFDPMSALMMLTRADGRPPCDRSVEIFDGKHRYNIILKPKRRMRLKTGRRTENAHVCSVRYKPVAGHRDNKDTQSFAANQNTELILRQVPHSEMLIPHAVIVPTEWGTGSMVAERIDVTTPGRGKIALTN